METTATLTVATPTDGAAVLMSPTTHRPPASRAVAPLSRRAELTLAAREDEFVTLQSFGHTVADVAVRAWLPVGLVDRDQVATKNLPRYGELRAKVFQLIQDAKRPGASQTGAAL